jgi:hypothetical protein
VPHFPVGTRDIVNVLSASVLSFVAGALLLEFYSRLCKTQAPVVLQLERQPSTRSETGSQSEARAA